VRTGLPPRGGTVLLCAADADGRMVSLIQSNFHGFGSGIVVPDWGIALQNRASGFVLDEGHPNELAPGRRPFHTIIPGFLLRAGSPDGADPGGQRRNLGVREGKEASRTRGFLPGEENQSVVPVGPFGVMGGHMQAQGHVQVVLRAALGADPQQALDAPRWRVEGDVVHLEQGLAGAAEGLAERGHRVVLAPPDDGGFGRGQAIWRDGPGSTPAGPATPAGTWVAGSETRCDGFAAGY
jgi:gamma-glutamyltranspeptidase / glutathione hydrolase